MASPWHIKDDNLRKAEKTGGVQDCINTPLHCNIGILCQNNIMSHAMIIIYFLTCTESQLHR